MVYRYMAQKKIKAETATSSVGYSGKPLGAKLGLKPGLVCLVVGAPDHYGDLIGDYRDGLSMKFAKRSPWHAGPFDLVHLFVPDSNTLQKNVDTAIGRLGEGGMLWISWPKKSSPLFIDLTEDGIRDIVLTTGWVDVKVAAVDAVWSGLKFLKRRAQ